jgi:hypothetical protein
MERGGARARVSLGLSPCNKFVPMISLTAYVLPSITNITILQYYTASQIQPFERWSHLRDLALADPKAAKQHTIHLLSESHICIDICARFPLSGPDRRFECV